MVIVLQRFVCNLVIQASCHYAYDNQVFISQYQSIWETYSESGNILHTYLHWGYLPLLLFLPDPPIAEFTYVLNHLCVSLNQQPFSPVSSADKKGPFSCSCHLFILAHHSIFAVCCWRIWYKRHEKKVHPAVFQYRNLQVVA